jgi:hypothetical protein
MAGITTATKAAIAAWQGAGQGIISAATQASTALPVRRIFATMVCTFGTDAVAGLGKGIYQSGLNIGV